MRVNKAVIGCKCQEQQLKMLQHSSGKKKKKKVPAVTNECIVKLDYHYHVH